MRLERSLQPQASTSRRGGGTLTDDGHHNQGQVEHSQPAPTVAYAAGATTHLGREERTGHPRQRAARRARSEPTWAAAGCQTLISGRATAMHREHGSSGSPQPFRLAATVAATATDDGVRRTAVGILDWERPTSDACGPCSRAFVRRGSSPEHAPSDRLPGASSCLDPDADWRPRTGTTIAARVEAIRRSTRQNGEPDTRPPGSCRAVPLDAEMTNEADPLARHTAHHPHFSGR